MTEKYTKKENNKITQPDCKHGHIFKMHLCPFGENTHSK